MRHALAKAILAICVLLAAIGAHVLAATGRFGLADGGLADAIRGVGFLVGLGALYAVVVCGLAAHGTMRLRTGKGLIASWAVEREDWERFAALTLADSGVSVPFLESLGFTPRRDPAFPVQVRCGMRSLIIDDAYFSLAPGRGAGMEEAGMTDTRPPCLAFVIAARAAGSGATRIVRTLLLVPVPAAAQGEAHRALRHYLHEIASVQGIGDFAAKNPAIARVVFWTVLVASLVAAGIGIWLETIDYPGLWPDAMAITGILVAPATLLLGWLWRPRSR